VNHVHLVAVADLRGGSCDWEVLSVETEGLCGVAEDQISGFPERGESGFAGEVDVVELEAGVAVEEVRIVAV